MSNPLPNSTSKLVKIGEASKLLGISIDTLRRWEKKGWIKAVKTPGGTRFYDISLIKKLNPALGPGRKYGLPAHLRASENQPELLQRSVLSLTQDLSYKGIDTNTQTKPQNLVTELLNKKIGSGSDASFDPHALHSHLTKGFHKQMVFTALLALIAVTAILSTLLTTGLIASYLINPGQTKSMFAKSRIANVDTGEQRPSHNIIGSLLNPFNNLAVGTINTFAPSKAAELGFLATVTDLPRDLASGLTDPKVTKLEGEVLAESTPSGTYLLINLDTKVIGVLDASTLHIANDASIDGPLTLNTVTYNYPASQGTASTFLQNDGTGTLAWTAVPLPGNATTTTVGVASFSDTNFAVSTAGAVTIKSGGVTTTEILDGTVANADLANSKVTVTAGSGLSGGGDVSLGSSVTLSSTLGTSVDLTSEVTGVLPIANGGSAKALTVAAGGVLWTDSDSFEVSAAGTSGQCLQSAGTSAPTWASCTASAVSGTTNTIAKFTSSTVVGDSSITDNGTTVTVGVAGSFSTTLAVTGITTLTGNLNANGGLDIDDAFVVADGGVLTTSQAANLNAGFDVDDIFSVADGGVLTISPSGTGTWLDFDLETEWTAGDLVNADWDSATTQSAALAGINLDFTNLTSVAGSTTYGLLINDLAAQTTSTEYAIYQEGTNWDLGALFEDDVRVGATDYLTISSVGDLTFTDSDGAASITGPQGGALGIAAANSQALNLTTTTAGNISLDPAGTGDIVFTLDSDGSVFTITDSANTTNDTVTISASALTTGTALTLTGPTSTGVTDHFVKVTSDIGSAAALVNLAPDFSGSAVTGYGLQISATDATANANSDYVFHSTLALTGNEAKTGVGLYSTVTSSSTTGDTLVGLDLATTVSGILAGATTRDVYGARIQPTAGAESAAGTTNVYGVYSKATADVAVGGTLTTYGAYIANGSGDAEGTTTNYGLYIEDISGADTNIDLNFTASPIVRIGDAGVLTFTEAGGNNTLCTLTDATNVGNLSCTGTITGAATGTVGYWSRASTTLSPATANDIVSIANTNTTGADFAITNTGIYTGTGLAAITANSATSGDILTISATAATSGSLLTLTGPSGGTAGVTDAALKITSDVGNIGTSNGLISSTATIDSTADTISGVNLYLSTTSSQALGTTVGQDYYGIRNILTKSGADTTSGTINSYGTYSTATNTGGDTAGTRNTYGGYFVATGDTSGTTATYGVYADANAADTSYGVYIDDGAGTTDYGIYQTGSTDDNYFAGFSGFGTDTTPDFALEVEGTEGTTLFSLTTGDGVISDGSLAITDDDNATSLSLTNNTATTVGAGVNTDGIIDFSSTSISTGNLVNIENTTSLSSGRLLNITTTSTALTSGNLLRLDWSPGSATTATGDLFSLNIGANGTTTGNLFNILDSSSSIFSVSETQFTTSLPSQFNSAGDVEIAYDLNFTNPTASYINSLASLTLKAGEPFNSSDLTLQTYNQGSIVFNTATTTGTSLDYTNSTLTTGTGFSLTSSNSSQTTATVLGITQSGVTTGYTGNLINISSTSTTGAATFFNLAADSSTVGTLMALSGNALTTGIGLAIDNGTSAMTTGSLLRVTAGGTGAIATNGIVGITHSGAYTSTSNAGLLNVTATGLVGTGTVVNIGASNASQLTDTLLNVSQTGVTTGYTGTAISFSTTATTGSGAKLLDIAANSMTVGDVVTVSGTALTTGSLLTLTGPSAGTAGVTDAALKIASDVGNIGTSNGLISSTAVFDGTTATGVNLYLTSSDAIAAANTDYGIYNSVTNTGAIDSAIIKTSYGNYTSVSSTLGAPTTAGTTNVYGNYITTTATHAGDFGTVNNYGLYIANGTSSTNGTSTKYGINIDDQSGADTNIDLNFTASPIVRIGDAGVLTFTEAGGNNTLCTLTDATNVGNLSCTGNITGSSSGTVGFWTRTSTTLAPATANDIVSIANTNTTGADLAITNTGVYTGTGLAAITANSATSGDILTISATAATSGSLLTLTGPSGGTAGVTDAGLKITSDVGNIGTSNGLISSTATIDSTADAISGVNLYLSTASSQALATTVGQTYYGLYNTLAKTGADTTSGTINSYGTYSTATNTGGDTAATRSTYGGYFLATGDTSGSTNAYGIRVDANGADASYGIFIDDISAGGAAFDYGIYQGTSSDDNYFAGQVGIGGDAFPDSLLEVGDGTDEFQIDADGDVVFVDADGAASITGPAGGALNITAGSGQALNLDSGTTGAVNIGTGANAKTITIGNNTTSTALAFTSGTGSQTHTSSVVSGTTTTSAFVFNGSALTSGTGIYATSATLTTGKLAQLSTGSSNVFSSGTLLDMRTTSTGLTGAAGTGSLLNLDWSPGSATTATGDLFALNIGTNGTTTGNLFNILDASSSIFAVAETNFTTSLPSNFTAAGDVSVAYDLAFTNPTASTITSAAPLSITAGESFNSSNLTLKTYNQGSIVADISGITTGTGIDVLASAVTTGNALNIAGSTSTGVTGNFVKLASDVGSGGSVLNLVPDFSGSAVAGRGLFVAATDSTGNANTDYAILSNLTLTGNAGKSGFGISTSVTSSSTTGDALVGGDFAVTHTGVTGTGNKTLYGVRAAVTNSAPTDTNAATIYGGHFTGTGNTGGTGSIAIGVYATASGADNNYPFYSGVAFPNNGSTAALCWDNAGESAIYDCTTPLADYAERYPAAGNVEYGDIVTSSANYITDKSGVRVPEMVKAQGAYSNVIGVASDNYSDFSSIGDNFESSVNVKAVAMTGRVPVKVTMENGTIKRGDFITTSSTAGKGMKSTRPGAVIGTALEDFNGPSDGVIQVFVKATYADPNDALASLLLDESGNLLGGEIQADSLTLTAGINAGGVVKASDFAMDASEINLVGSLASVPVSTENKVSLADTINAINYEQLSIRNEVASNSAQIAQAQNLSEQAIQQSNVLAESVNSTNSVLSTLQSQIDSLLSSFGGDDEASNSATPSANLAQNNPINLTAPEVMFATGSATLADLEVTSEATISGNLTAYTATIQDTFKALGNTFLGHTTVAGDITQDGTLSITEGSKINALPKLYFQTSPLASGADFFNGAVTINNKGLFQAESLALGSQSLGEAIIAAGQTELIIPSSLIKPNSKVFLTPTTALQGNLFVSQLNSGSGFKVKLTQPNLANVKFNWLIVQSKEASN